VYGGVRQPFAHSDGHVTARTLVSCPEFAGRLSLLAGSGLPEDQSVNVTLKDKLNVIACAGVQIFALAAGGLIMKGRQALLFTSDTEFESVVRQALLGTDTIFLIARTVSDALQIACQRGRELDLAIMTFAEDCHGMTFLSAIHDCYEQLPTLVVVEKDSGHASALAYANGACVCLSKPVSLVELTNAIATLRPTARQLAVA
jgi:CheY-like chemotaxis protein